MPHVASSVEVEKAILQFRFLDMNMSRKGT